MSTRRHALETRLIHSTYSKYSARGQAPGSDRAPFEGAITTPIFQTSTYLDGDTGGDTVAATAGDTNDGRGYEAVRYTLLSNGPQHLVLHARLADITDHEAAITSSSGMAAISAALIAHAAGGRIFFSRHLYGGTAHLAKLDLPSLGIACDLATSDDPRDWPTEVKPHTKVVYVEAISNPTNVITDLTAVVELAHSIGALAVIDATFASPVNLKPAALGFDLELHSATKYLNGHSDVIAGAVCGKRDLVQKVLSLQNHLGGSLDPHAAFLLERGLKTLTLRVRHQNASAEHLARVLDLHPAVLSCTHPALAPETRIPSAMRPCFKGFGGVFSFDVGSADRAAIVLRSLTIARHAPSLGGPETLVTRPAATSHASLSPHERVSLGITDGLIRVSVGFEATEDLVADFTAALASLPT